MDREALRELREGIAEAKGLVLYREYDEAAAAGFLEMHPRTLAQMRREGRLFFVRKGPRNIRYLGLHLADFIIESIGRAAPTPPAAPPPTAAPREKSVERAPSAHRLAERTFGRPRSR